MVLTPLLNESQGLTELIIAGKQLQQDNNLTENLPVIPGGQLHW